MLGECLGDSPQLTALVDGRGLDEAVSGRSSGGGILTGRGNKDARCLLRRDSHENALLVWDEFVVAAPSLGARSSEGRLYRDCEESEMRLEAGGASGGFASWPVLGGAVRALLVDSLPGSSWGTSRLFRFPNVVRFLPDPAPLSVDLSNISPADDFERLNDWNRIFFFGCGDSRSTGGAVVTIEGAGPGIGR